MLHRLEVIGDRENSKASRKDHFVCSFAHAKDHIYDDYDLLTDDKARESIYNAFANTKYDFDFVIIFDKNQRLARQIEKTQYLSNGESDPSRITIVCANNINGEALHVPMNSLGLARRAMLAFHFRDIFGGNSFPSIGSGAENEIRCEILGNLHTQMDRISEEKIIAPNRISNAYFLSYLSLIQNKSMDCYIRNHVDIMSALGTKFIFNGKISLNRFIDWNKYEQKVKIWDKPFSSAQLEEIDNLIDATEVKLNNMFKKILDSMVGKVWCF